MYCVKFSKNKNITKNEIYIFMMSFLVIEMAYNLEKKYFLKYHQGCLFPSCLLIAKCPSSLLGVSSYSYMPLNSSELRSHSKLSEFLLVHLIDQIYIYYFYYLFSYRNVLKLLTLVLVLLLTYFCIKLKHFYINI